MRLQSLELVYVYSAADDVEQFISNRAIGLPVQGATQPTLATQSVAIVTSRFTVRLSNVACLNVTMPVLGDYEISLIG